MTAKLPAEVVEITLQAAVAAPSVHKLGYGTWFGLAPYPEEPDLPARTQTIIPFGHSRPDSGNARRPVADFLPKE